MEFFIRSFKILPRNLVLNQGTQFFREFGADESEEVRLGRQNDGIKSFLLSSQKQVSCDSAGKAGRVLIVVMKTAIEPVLDGSSARTRDTASRPVRIQLSLGEVAAGVLDSLFEFKGLLRNILIERSLGSIRQNIPKAMGF